MNDQYINDPGTTLAASINNSTTSLTVTSSSGYPSGTCSFIIEIGSELLRVTNISHPTWTIARAIESTVAAAHNIGDPVNAVATAGSLLAQANLFGTLASRPSTALAGQRFVCSDSPYEFIGNPDGTWQALVAGFAATVPDISSNWTFDSAGSPTADHATGAIILNFDPAGGDLCTYYHAAPSAPYKLRFRLRVLSWGGVGSTAPVAYGVAFRDGSGKLVSFTIITTATARGLETDKWTGKASFDANYKASTTNLVDVGVAQLAAFPEVWLHIEDDSTNLKFSYSLTGHGTPILYDSRSRTDKFASGPTQYGVCAMFIGGATEGVQMEVLDITRS